MPIIVVDVDRRARAIARLGYLLQSMRPKQWTKNLLLYLAFLLSVNEAWHLSQPGEMVQLAGIVSVAFVLFCCISSSEYLINDLADLKRDQEHPTKRNRPLPSGRLPRSHAIAAAIALPAVCLPAAFWLHPAFGFIVSTYFVMTIGYTFFLKHMVILDVFTIAAGFVLRAVAGAVVIEVPISPWLYICTVLAALFFGLTKRRAELLLLREDPGRHRRTLEDYSLGLLDQMITVVAAAAVMAYSLYTFSAPNLPPNHAMMLTIPFALYAVFRYLYLVHARNEGGSPEEVLLSDKPLIIDIVLWAAVAVGILVLLRPV